MELSRRAFLRTLGSGACGFVAGQFFSSKDAQASLLTALSGSASRTPSELNNLTLKDFGFPHFDGTLLLQPNDLVAFAWDFGRTVHRTPRAVLQPAHSDDVIKMAKHCEQNQIKLAIRGTGGAAYGQTLVEDGVVIDTSTLKSIRWLGSDLVEVGPGLVWRDFVNATYPHGYVPPVMPDTIVTSVGGTASVGGIGETSFCLGAMTDHLHEIEIATLSGQIFRCSQKQNPELFWACLGGMGQIGIITSVVMRLRACPKVVYSADFGYSAQSTALEILNDFDQLAHLNQSEDVISAVGGHFNRTAGTDEFSYTMHVSIFDRQPPAELDQLKGKRTGPWKSMNYLEYASRNLKGWDSAVASGALNFPKPYLSFYLPWSQTESFMNLLWKNPTWHLGSGRIYFAPLHRKHFSTGTLALPNESRLTHVRLYKIIRNGAMGSDHLEALKANQDEMIPEILGLGGTVYLPFSPLLSAKQEMHQFGAADWKKLSELKKQNNPFGLLNPGAELFV